MSDKFVILHLSDAHLGNPKHLHDSLNVFDPLLKDLTDYYSGQNLKPSLIVFSGDLAFGSIPDNKIEKQYIVAKDYLEKIYSCFGVTYGNIPLLIVPGNHDIDRELIGDGDRLLRDQLTAEQVSNMMYKNEITWKRLLERQKAWFDFVSAIPGQPWNWDTAFHMATGTLDHHGIKIGIAGLNSSWASHQEKETGNLWIGRRQYDAAYQAIISAKFKIAVSHHPVDWLHSEEKGIISQKIDSQFDIFLHGHEHAHWFTDSKKHLKCAAGACYSGSKNRNGYSWLEIDFKSSDARIILREYTDQGKGGWRANTIPDKTNEHGVGNLTFLKTFESVAADEALATKACDRTTTISASKFPDKIESLLSILQDRFFFRWESGNIVQSDVKPLIYWPVSLRKPTPIHAAQCFVAAGLNKLGCDISLWIDGLGTSDYSIELFTDKLKYWFKKAGADESRILIRNFDEILKSDNDHITEAWDMLQSWLVKTSYHTDKILQISKIWPSVEGAGKEDPKDILDEFAKRRPRRLLTPSMVWTCLLVLSRENVSRPIITLGGHDEKELWEAWRKCCVLREVQVGHLYVPKLTQRKNDVERAIHMQVDRLAWTSKQDIEDEFRKSVSEDDSRNAWQNSQSMIPWVVSNCVLLPIFVADAPSVFTINNCPVNRLDDLNRYSPSDILDDLVGAANSWLL